MKRRGKLNDTQKTMDLCLRSDKSKYNQEHQPIYEKKTTQIPKDLQKNNKTQIYQSMTKLKKTLANLVIHVTFHQESEAGSSGRVSTFCLTTNWVIDYKTPYFGQWCGYNIIEVALSIPVIFRASNP